MMRFLGFILAAILILAPWSTLTADSYRNSKCITLANPKTCQNVANSGCGTLSSCTGSCSYCDSSYTLPDNVCVNYENSNCITQYPYDRAGCDAFAYILFGSCANVNGSTNCTCENPSGTQRCGTDYTFAKCTNQ
jgi:hypothetical protein